MKKLIAVFAVLSTCVVVGTTVGVALAVPPADQICPDSSSGKIDVSGDQTSVTVTAPAGQLISGYCVKAGSEKQGLGAEFVTVNPPQASVTITHSSGKGVSHYSLTFVTAPPLPPLPPLPPPPPPAP